MPASDSQEWPTALPLPAVGPARILDPRSRVLSFDSGRRRIIRAYEEYLESVEFEWKFTEDEFETFKAFFEDDLFNGEFPFYITLLDPDDSSQEIVTDYVFFDADYQWTRSDNLFHVVATVLVQERAIEAIPEPFFPNLCGVEYSGSEIDVDGSGGNTFECYAVGVYTTDMEVSGTGMAIIRNGTSPYAVAGERFEVFALGDLVLGSPSQYSGLSLMLHGDNPFLTQFGEDFETYDAGTLGSGTPPEYTGLDSFESA